MSYTSPFTILASAARTETVTSGAIDLSDQDEAILFLDVTAVSGTSPTLNVKIEVQNPLGDWYEIAAFAQKTATGKEAKQVTIFGSKLRVNCVIGGTSPSFTFSLTAIAKRK